MYYVKLTNNNYGIFFEDDYTYKPIMISMRLSKSQADKWCERLNAAYKRGIASQY